MQRWYQNDTEVKEYLEKVESSVKNLEKEVREQTQDIKDKLGGKVESTAQEAQRLGQDIKDELGGKVESTAQEVQRMRQEFRDKAQDIKDQLNQSGRPSSSAGGQLVDFFLYLFYQ